jgi:hypothetical protein
LRIEELPFVGMTGADDHQGDRAPFEALDEGGWIGGNVVEDEAVIVGYATDATDATDSHDHQTRKKCRKGVIEDVIEDVIREVIRDVTRGGD